jgi:hypothetical protein
LMSSVEPKRESHRNQNHVVASSQKPVRPGRESHRKLSRGVASARNSVELAREFDRNQNRGAVSWRHSADPELDAHRNQNQANAAPRHSFRPGHESHRNLNHAAAFWRNSVDPGRDCDRNQNQASASSRNPARGALEPHRNPNRAAASVRRPAQACEQSRRNQSDPNAPLPNSVRRDQSHGQNQIPADVFRGERRVRQIQSRANASSRQSFCLGRYSRPGQSRAHVFPENSDAPRQQPRCYQNLENASLVSPVSGQDRASRCAQNRPNVLRLSHPPWGLRPRNPFWSQLWTIEAGRHLIAEQACWNGHLVGIG